MTLFRFSEFSYKEIPESIWEAWMDCSQSWHVEPFHAPIWVHDQPWMKKNIPYASLLVGTDERNNYLGFWPYQVVEARLRGVLPVRLCCTWGGENQVDPGVGTRARFWAICSPNPPSGFPSAFVEAFIDRTRWNILRTGDLQCNDLLFVAWEDSLRGRCLRNRKIQHASAVIGQWDSFDAYFASLPSKMRQLYRRFQKHNLTSGKVLIERWDDFTSISLSQFIKRIGAIYCDSWKVSSDLGMVNLALADTLENFSARISAFARSGGLHILFVIMDGVDVAFHVGVSHGETYISLQAAYREKYAASGVGTFAQLESFRHTFERGIRKRNLLAYLDYKKQFRAEVSHSFSYTVFNRDAIGTVVWHLDSIIRSLRGVRFAC